MSQMGKWYNREKCSNSYVSAAKARRFKS